MGGQELEWQFDALDLRPVVRWLGDSAAWGDTGAVAVAPAGTVNHVDLYLDTEGRRFHCAGYALRIRRTGGRLDGEATLKALDSADDAGLRSRREMSERLERADADALVGAAGAVGERVRAVAGKQRVRPLFEVRTRRRLFALQLDGLPPAEIALDETAITPPEGGPPARLRRVEVEAPEAAVPACGPFVERLRAACALQTARLSKYEAGALSTGLRAPERAAFGPTAIDPDATIRVVALAVLRRHFSVLVAKEPGTRLGDDIEELHDMRVATRRLRAALALFADVLPPSVGPLRDELGWVGRTLGAVRDLDVQLEQLDEWLRAIPEADRDALGALRALLEEQRAGARVEMLAALDSRRYELFVGRFGRMLRTGRATRSGPSAQPAPAVAPDLIEGRFRPFRKGGDRIGPASSPEEYHRLRIRCKRLRYALEFLGDVYPGHARPLIKRLVRLQDVLGLHQDADVAIDRLRRLAAERGRELPAETVFAMGEIAERYAQSMVALRAEFPAAYARVRGKSWKAFRSAIEERRPTL